MPTIPPAESPGHPFVRPGQVAPDLPPPDNCVGCGLPEAAHGALPASAEYRHAIGAAEDAYVAARLQLDQALARGDIDPEQHAGAISAAEAERDRACEEAAHPGA